MAKNELTTVEKFNLVTGMEEMDEELKAELEDELGDLDEENGIINYPDGVTADNAGYSFNCGWELPNQFIAYKWDGSDPQLWDKMQEFNASGIESKALGFVFDNSEYADQVSALNNVISQYNGALSSGSGDPEELLPQFLEALDDAGIDDVIAAKQEQLDAFLAKK